MSYLISILTDEKTVFVNTDNDLYVSKTLLGTDTLNLSDITSIGITKNLILMCKSYEKCNTSDNINAYDRAGNYLWNISDIVTDAKGPFVAIGVHSVSGLSNFLSNVDSLIFFSPSIPFPLFLP